MFCPKCGSDVDQQNSFCTVCGNPFDFEDQHSSASEKTQAVPFSTLCPWYCRRGAGFPFRGRPSYNTVSRGRGNSFSARSRQQNLPCFGITVATRSGLETLANCRQGQQVIKGPMALRYKGACKLPARAISSFPTSDIRYQTSI